MATETPETTAAHQDTEPTQGLEAYRRVFTAPGVRPLLLFSILARIPMGTGGVAIILFVHSRTGSFGAAGIVAGAYTVGLGITGPPVARLIDRHGSRWLIVPGSILVAAAMSTIVFLGEAGAGTIPLVAAALVAGAASIPIGGVLRQRWPDLVAPAELPTAFALDSVMIEVIFVSGPLLAGILAATVGSDFGLFAAAALGIVGSIGFARLSTVRPGADPDAERHWLGALTSPTLRLLVFSQLPLAGTFGALDVTLPAFGAHHGAAALGGPYAAALAFGSGVGGIAFGARPGLFGSPRRSLLTLGALMVLTCLPLPFATSIPEMFVFAAIAGLCIAPQFTVRNQIVQATVISGTVTEAFTWLTLAITIGASLGSALVGPLVEAAGWRAGTIVAAALPAAATLVLLARRDLLDPRAPGP